MGDQKCYVCGKSGCWSTKHTKEERTSAYDRFRKSSYLMNSSKKPTQESFQQFLLQWEGQPQASDGEFTQSLIQMDTWHTAVDEFNGVEAIALLRDKAVRHAITRTADTEDEADKVFSYNRYSDEIFQGIIPDTGAAGISTAGEPQYRALQRLDASVRLDATSAGSQRVRFGKGEASSIGTIQVATPLGKITFHVVPANTPFLYCLSDMDKMGVRLDNLRNVLIQGNTTVPVVRKYGHPFLLLDRAEESLTYNHLTETQLRQLHRRFGHPSVQKLTSLLERAGHDVDNEIIKKLSKYCHQCQLHSKSPGRFKFTLKDDYDFNYSVVADVFYIKGKPVLQVVDSETAFQAARFLADMKATTAWQTILECWISTYLGPPDIIISDAGTNFTGVDFKQAANSMNIEVKEVPVEAHHSIGKVEVYHAPLRRSYEIIRAELGPEYSDDICLQLAVKAVNDTAGPNGLVPTLLVFGAYPRIADDPPTTSVLKRAQAARTAMKELRRLNARRKLQGAKSMRNGPNTTPVLNLPLQSDVLVYRENDGWTGPFKLIAMDGETCVIDMPYGQSRFRSTVVKPYYAEASQDAQPAQPPQELQPTPVEDDIDSDIIVVEMRELQTRRSQRSRRTREQCLTSFRDICDAFTVAVIDGNTFLTHKEQGDLELSKKLRQEGVITTPGEPFEESTKAEIESLMAAGVFKIVQFDARKHTVKVFNSRVVNEVKGKTTVPFEKTRLVIQAYDDAGKELILTQSPTIQRASQRLLIALAPTLQTAWVIDLWLRDVTQAYTQSNTLLQRVILANLPKEIRHRYPRDSIWRSSNRVWYSRGWNSLVWHLSHSPYKEPPYGYVKLRSLSTNLYYWQRFVWNNRHANRRYTHIGVSWFQPIRRL